MIEAHGEARVSHAGLKAAQAITSDVGDGDAVIDDKARTARDNVVHPGEDESINRRWLKEKQNLWLRAVSKSDCAVAIFLIVSPKPANAVALHDTARL